MRSTLLATAPDEPGYGREATLPGGAAPHSTTDLARTIVLSLADGTIRHGERAVATEIAANVVYGGIPFAVMMVTPADLEDFARGFSLTEGVIERLDDLRGVTVESDPLGLRILVDLAPERLGRHLARRRALAGRTGCGVCGIDDLAALRRAGSAVEAGRSGPHVTPAALRRALAELEAAQSLAHATGAVHAAGFAGPDGAVRLVREDVGRHNALDKLIGAALSHRFDPADGFLVITSRCSFEMVEKAAAFGARILVAMSAPTALAIERARERGVAIAASVRAGTATIYCGAERFGIAADARPEVADLGSRFAPPRRQGIEPAVR